MGMLAGAPSRVPHHPPLRRNVRFTGHSEGVAVVVSLVFVVGMLNLVVGFALAIALERRFVLYLPTWRRDSSTAALAALTVERPLSRDPDRDLLLGQVPDKWAAWLEQANTEFHSFVEASVHALRLEVSTYRNDLLDVEDLVRSAVATNDAGAIRDAVEKLVALTEAWVVGQTDAARVMEEKREVLGAHAALGNQLTNLLVHQAQEIKNHCQIIASHDPKLDEDAGTSIVQELGQLVRLADQLRDAIQDALVAIVTCENRLETSDRQLHVDPATGLRNRLGAERQFTKWWLDDDRHQRLLSVALIDIDRCGKLNEFASTRVADHILQGLAGLLKQLASRDSGFERVFRWSGHQFLLFFGDASCEAAVGNVERIRQAIEATRFDYQEKQYVLTVRAGVTDVRPDEGTAGLLGRLQELAAAARQAGGNRTGTDLGNKVDVVLPCEPAQPPRTIKVE